jgi:DNA-binding response OmpR family regulator
MDPRTVIIVEDEPILREALTLKLTQQGFTVKASADGKEGLALIQKSMPHLVLLDLNLPSMKGEDILKTIKDDPATKSIPVVIISNSGQPVEIKDILDRGADDYIVKANLTIEDVLERVNNAIERQGGNADVVVAEDEDILRKVLTQKLRKEGFKVVSAVDGDIALKTILQAKPKLVLLDLFMPSLSGMEVLERLKKDPNFDRAKTQIIVLSNYTGKEDEPIIKEMTQGYFIKAQFPLQEIVSKVKAVLG